MAIETQNTARVSILVGRTRQYSDLDLSLAIHPDFHDLVPLRDTEAVKNSVRNLVLTNFMERPFQPTVGSNLRALLFEPADDFTSIAIREGIHRVLARWEPRVDSVTVLLEDEPDQNRYRATLGFRVVATSQPVDVSLYLIRIR